MAKTIYKKVMFVGRATTFMVGLAVILALTVGLTSTALAGTGVGAAFNLGQLNTVNAISKLAGSVAGSSLVIENNSTDAAATALNLKVAAGKAPMKVNSATKVANLNSDKLDNLDSSGFVRSVYTRSESTTGVLTVDDQMLKTVFCDDADDFALSGGYSGVDAGTEISSSNPNFIGTNPEGWIVRWRNDATPDTINVMVVCAEIGTPQQ
jgi:hypothetical protein